MNEILANNEKKEYIICAALCYTGGMLRNLPHMPKYITHEVVVCGRRHHNCFSILSELLSYRVFGKKFLKWGCKNYLRYTVQGFLTSKDRFVNRDEAAVIAFKAKQIDNPVDSLFSEDLY